MSQPSTAPNILAYEALVESNEIHAALTPEQRAKTPRTHFGDFLKAARETPEKVKEFTETARAERGYKPAPAAEAAPAPISDLPSPISGVPPLGEPPHQVGES
jgi:hypothetical protein